MTVDVSCSGLFLIGIDSPAVAVRTWNRVLKTAARHGALYWAEKLLPKHFERSNWHVYGDAYFKRKASTQKKKARLYHHTAALVNYPIHEPPADRQTLEGFMLRTLPSITSRGTQCKLRWATPGISRLYKDEATAMNRQDTLEVLGVVNKVVVGALRGRGRRPLLASAKLRVAGGLPRKRTGRRRIV